MYIVRSNASSASSTYLSTRYQYSTGYASAGHHPHFYHHYPPPSSYHYYQQRSISATTSPYYAASPASISPSPSPVCGFSSSSPSSRYYLGWRATLGQQFNSATLYKTANERLAEDLISKKKQSESESSLVSGISIGSGVSSTTGTADEDDRASIGSASNDQQQQLLQQHKKEEKETKKQLKEQKKRERYLSKYSKYIIYTTYL